MAASPLSARPQRLLLTGLSLFLLYAVTRHLLANFYTVTCTQDVVAYEWWLSGANLALCAALAWAGWKAWGWSRLWNLPGRPWMALILGVGVVLSCGYSWSDQVMTPMTRANDPVRVAALGLGLAMALAEEVGFRGLLYSAAEEWLGEDWAILVSAALFTLLHLSQRLCAASPRTAMGGLALSLARSRGLNLGQLICIHFAAEAAWALFLPLAGPMDTPKELTSAAINGLVCVALWRMKSRAGRALTA